MEAGWPALAPPEWVPKAQEIRPRCSNSYDFQTRKSELFATPRRVYTASLALNWHRILSQAGASRANLGLRYKTLSELYYSLYFDFPRLPFFAV